MSISPRSTSARSSSRVSGTRHSYTATGMDRKRPVIGISAYDVPVDFGQWKDMRCVLVPEGYVRSVAAAGGVPVLIPPTEVAPAIIEDVDAMVFTGGSDLNPALYGQEPHPESSGFYDHRDAAELELMRAALAQGMPVLGICRGMQLLNVARGGDLIQHLDGETHKGPPGTYTRHSVTVLAGNAPGRRARDGRPHALLPPSGARARSATGCGSRRPPRTERSRRSRIPAARHVVGVLWHPEEDEEGGAALFRALVDQATTYRRAAA